MKPDGRFLDKAELDSGLDNWVQLTLDGFEPGCRDATAVPNFPNLEPTLDGSMLLDDLVRGTGDAGSGGSF